MDFMKWLNSLDELLYEVISWLLFFPLTLWRSLFRPIAMMRYADRQLELAPDEQYADALSPPLFLVLALLLAHGVSTALGEKDAIVERQTGLAGMIQDDSSALVLRLLLFASFALFAAVRSVRLIAQPINRANLRLPFYAQCYPTAVVALGVSTGTSLASLAPDLSLAGGALILGSVLHYAAVETRWFAERLAIGYGRAFLAVLLVLLQGTALLLAVGLLLTR